MKARADGTIREALGRMNRAARQFADAVGTLRQARKLLRAHTDFRKAKRDSVETYTYAYWLDDSIGSVLDDGPSRSGTRWSAARGTSLPRPGA